MEKTLQQQRYLILETALLHIPKQGWSDKVLNEAIAEVLPDFGSAHILFPEGPIDLLKFFVEKINEDMLKTCSYLMSSTSRTSEKIKKCLLERFKIMEPYKTCIDRSKNLLYSPQHASTATNLLYSVTDTVWYICGDKSTDWNFYTKRLLLGFVYTATLMKWLDSPHNYPTDNLSDFIDEKLILATKPAKIKNQAFKFVRDLKSKFFL